MKGLDVFIVRFIPFILFIIYGMNVLYSCMDKEPFLSYALHGNSAIYAFVLFVVSLANKKYHCIWNRAMYGFLILVPIFNYLDSQFDIAPRIETYILIINISYVLTALITAFLAIRHFVKMSKRRLEHGGK